MPTYTNFEQLECWKLCREVVRSVRILVRSMPSYERYDMISNITRAARSATRNIAEGFGRYYFKDRIKFCRTSRGSLYEVIDDLITCLEEGYADQEFYTHVRSQTEDAIHSVNGYIKYLEARERRQPEDPCSPEEG